MKNKLIFIAFAILLIIAGVFAFMYFHTNSKLENAESKYNLEKLEALEKQEKEKNLEFEQKEKNYLKQIDTLSSQEQSIKYIPYEKLLYTDRDVDAALDIIADYKFDSRPNKKAQ